NHSTHRYTVNLLSRQRGKTHPGNNVLSEEQFLCSVCLDVFTEPVSIPCGHNFCKACISEYWNTTALCQCPLCKDTFNRRPDLKTNTTLREVSSSKPGEVAQVQQMIQERQDPELRRIRQWSVDVTLDPDTAHCKLIVSEDRKQVSYGDVRQILPDLPERFECYLSVLGKEGFSSGRFYFEVQVRGKIEWQVGVARESIIRKGPTAVSPEGGLWALYMNRNKYIAKDTPHMHLFPSQKPQKVGVFVDYKEGQISFYDVENMSHIYSFTGCTFTEKLYPYLNPCDNEEGPNSAPLVISPVNHTD
uniref:Uncharacterized protein n=1 Tax=Oncorhynchus kisutch TaxID=8019 RepID=A0A8C7HJV4_ONCKI